MPKSQTFRMKRLFCPCPQEFQDKRYGKHMRIHNEKGGKSLFSRWRCTGCGKEQS